MIKVTIETISNDEVYTVKAEGHNVLNNLTYGELLQLKGQIVAAEAAHKEAQAIRQGQPPEFLPGDRVKVRNVNSEPWLFGIYSHYEEGTERPYRAITVDGTSFKECKRFV